MTTDNTASWQSEFGLDNRHSSEFFDDPSELTPEVAQAHLLKRGFEDLRLDGVLCSGNSPLVYFRCEATPEGFRQGSTLHRQNLGSTELDAHRSHE